MLLTLLFSTAFAQPPAGEVTFWNEVNINVSTEWAEAFSTHSWTTACPGIMDLSDKAFSLTFAPVHDGDAWTYEVSASLSRVGGYGYENATTQCLEVEATEWLTAHPIQPMVLLDENWGLRISWQHPDAVRKPMRRETVEPPQETPRSPYRPAPDVSDVEVEPRIRQAD